ncbi:ATP-dependent DNA ligase [Methanospirillum sp.]|uniref:ATP-dependent DNA ligase n=2 Tax=Methanospirillum sp. TaxID=45200 RepID=UPI002D1FA950|nr:ATP-dependent DNA ligase [Methanospirillum sp.]
MSDSIESFFQTLHTISTTGSRIVKKQILINYLKTLDSADLIIIMNILLNNYVTNVGPSLISKFKSAQTSLFPETITIEKFHEILQQFTYSSTENAHLIQFLFMNTDIQHRNYIRKILLNNINIGISEVSILESLSEVLQTDAKSQYFIIHDISRIINKQYRGPELFNPIMSMLADSTDISKYPEDYSIEYKYDGFRHQYHKSDSLWKIFSRKPEDISYKVYETGEFYTKILNSLNVQNIILDGELISPNMKFQDAVKKHTSLVPVIFDILYLNNTSLLDTPYIKRREILENLLKNTGITISKRFDKSMLYDTYSEALKSGYEGIIVKNNVEPYIPNERKWIKMKRQTDSMDLVITGAVMGEGKRSHLYGSFILSGLYNDELSPVCRVGTGFTDAELEILYKILKPYEVVKSDGSIHFPDIRIYVEIDYFEITDSPLYPCGKSLRFPVFKQIRTDKSLSTIQNLNKLIK